jgi:cytoskeleton protein RodZ
MTPEGQGSAGAMLRAAREKQGLHIAALAAAIKVSPKKLEALEADRHDEFAGAIFTRALAQSVCRVLRIDAKPVLALLPQPDAPVLDSVTGPLNAPFRDRASRDDRPLDGIAQRVLVAAGVVLMLAAVALFLWPQAPWTTAAPGPAASAPAPVEEASPAAAPRASTLPPAAPVDTAASVPAPALAASAAVPVAVPASAHAAVPAAATTPPPAAPAASVIAAAAALQIQVTAASWVEVRERGGRVLLSRLLPANETVALDGAFPLQLTIGNAVATRVTLRGRPVLLTSVSRDNVARVELN